MPLSEQVNKHPWVFLWNFSWFRAGSIWKLCCFLKQLSHLAGCSGCGSCPWPRGWRWCRGVTMGQPSTPAPGVGLCWRLSSGPLQPQQAPDCFGRGNIRLSNFFSAPGKCLQRCCCCAEGMAVGDTLRSCFAAGSAQGCYRAWGWGVVSHGLFDVVSCLLSSLPGGLWCCEERNLRFHSFWLKQHIWARFAPLFFCVVCWLLHV